MGGLGSGKNYMQATTDDALNIDIRWLKKHGKLIANTTGKLSWSRRDREIGQISYTVLEDSMKLNYSCDGVVTEQTIIFEETPCHYGGVRKWLQCPKCFSRVAIVYMRWSKFQCRHCARLPYKSTLQSSYDRDLHKKHTLGREIFEDYRNGDGWRKKKGMHQKTFNKKLTGYRKLERKCNGRFISVANSLHNRLYP
jgi:hypothetical protein